MKKGRMNTAQRENAKRITSPPVCKLLQKTDAVIQNIRILP